MKSHRIQRFAILNEKISEGFSGSETMILVKGGEDYAALLRRAFPGISFDGPYPDDSSEFDWFLIAYTTDEQQADVATLLGVLTSVLRIKDGLDECFALAQHMVLTESGGFARTSVGQTVREAKPYDTGWNAGSKQQAVKLAAMLHDFVRAHPTYARAPLVAAVPASNPDKRFDLPTFLVEQVAAATGKENATPAIRKARTTRPMKDCATLAEKAANIKDAFVIDATRLAGKSVVLIDDIYHTGTSINELGRLLRAGGAQAVFGLTLTKTIRNF